MSVLIASFDVPNFYVSVIIDRFFEKSLLPGMNSNDTFSENPAE